MIILNERDEYNAALQQFSNCELNDLVRELNHTKDASELLVLRLKEKNMLGPTTTFF